MPDIFATESESVRHSKELTRILQLPRRSWSTEEAEELSVELTELLKTPHGEMKLRPIQAIALYEIGTYGGVLGPQTVGAGKTLISFLAPVVAFAKRPLLLVPAKLLKKTERDRKYLAKHWRLPEFLRVLSYEWLGREQAAEALTRYQPDFVIADEGHKVRNKSAAVTRRVFRFFSANPDVKALVMSGTLTKRSLHDYGHITKWCMPPDQMPLPQHYQDLENWADALDSRKGQKRRLDPGALIALCNDEEKKLWRTDKLKAARSAFRRRLVETPGIVATHEAQVDASLEITAVELETPKVLDEAFEKLRSTWETPDEWPLADGLQMNQHARELALGFFYRWDPRPPKYWLDARREWCAYVRKILKHSRHLDSELQVRRAHQDSQELQAWKAVAKDFEPNTVAVWLHDHVLEFCMKWAEEHRGIVWTEHQTFGQRLSELGLSYYGRKGQDAKGRIVEDHPSGGPFAASIASNGEGRNLQAWSTNLITSAPANGLRWEQLIGRTHREGQEADEVSFDVLTTCAEHVTAFWQAVADCEYSQDSTGAPQKLLLAGVNMPSVDDIMSRRGARWIK